MKKIIIIFCIIFLISCSNEQRETKENRKPKTEEELKQELLEKEIQQPSKYLKLYVVREDPLFGRAYLVCTVVNNATLATYKDIVIQVQYYSKTNTMIKSWDNTMYEFIPPNRERKMEIGLLKYGDEVSTIKTVIVDVSPVK